jgi:anti-sigma factor RsiW
MDNKVHLITEQDVHAYIDGELSGDRRIAVERFLAERQLPLERAARYLRNNFDLRAVRDEIYEDRDLKNEIEQLLAKRNAPSARRARH